MSEQEFMKLIKQTCFCLMILIGAGMYGCPQYAVWERSLSGKAKLSEAEYSRKIVIEEAKAKLEAAKELSLAEIERAKGVAEANKIIGESLRSNEAYLRYLWINQLSENNNSVIYVPTETNLPILEANRLRGAK